MQHGDPQRADRRADLGGERAVRRRGVAPAEPVRSGDLVEDGRGVADGMRQDALDRRAHPAGDDGRDAAAARLEADETGARCGDADRAATVVAVGEREHAGGDGRRRAAARPAGRARRVPRVAGDPVTVVLGDRDRPVLGGVRPPGEHEAGPSEGGDDELVVVTRPGRPGRRPIRHRPAGHRGQVLHRQRDAGERWEVVVAGGDGVGDVAGVGPRLVVVAPDDRVQDRVRPVDLGEAVVEQLDRAELSAADGVGQVGGGVVAVHAGTLRRRSSCRPDQRGSERSAQLTLRAGRPRTADVGADRRLAAGRCANMAV